MSLSDIRDMINDDNPEIDTMNNELNGFLEGEFGNNIQFCLSDSKYTHVCIVLICYCK